MVADGFALFRPELGGECQVGQQRRERVRLLRVFRGLRPVVELGRFCPCTA